MRERSADSRKARWRAVLSAAVAVGGVVFAVRGEVLFGAGLLIGGAGVGMISLVQSPGPRPAADGPWRIAGGALAAAGILLLLLDFFVAP